MLSLWYPVEELGGWRFLKAQCHQISLNYTKIRKIIGFSKFSIYFTQNTEIEYGRCGIDYVFC